jgi:hypothetical protein
MEITTRFRRWPSVAIAALCSAPLLDAQAATVARYDFDDDAGGFINEAEDLAAQLSASGWSDIDGTLGSAAGNPGFALSARDFADGNEYRITLTPAPGFTLGLSSVRFDSRASTTGPAVWALSIDGVEIASGATATTFTTADVPLASAAGSAPLVLGLRGTQAASSLGTWRLDNVVLSGAVTPVPVPAGGWLFGAAGLSLLLRRRPARMPAAVTQ